MDENGQAYYMDENGEAVYFDATASSEEVASEQTTEPELPVEEEPEPPVEAEPELPVEEASEPQEPVAYTAEDGSTYYLDENGYAYYLDEKGNPYYVDENGQAYYMDENGEAVYFDATASSEEVASEQTTEPELPVEEEPEPPVEAEPELPVEEEPEPPVEAEPELPVEEEPEPPVEAEPELPVEEASEPPVESEAAVKERTKRQSKKSDHSIKGKLKNFFKKKKDSEKLVTLTSASVVSVASENVLDVRSLLRVDGSPTEKTFKKLLVSSVPFVFGEAVHFRPNMLKGEPAVPPDNVVVSLINENEDPYFKG